MNPNCLNLKGMKETLEETLNGYDSLLNGVISFGDVPDIQLTPEKPNSARTVVSVTYGNKKVGDMYVIVFEPQDGTGDANTYKPNEIIIPECLKFRKKPERVIPRAKTGVISEYFLPFFSSNIETGMSPKMYFTYLDELVLDNNMKIRGSTILGNMNSEDNFNCQPKIQMTTGFTPKGIRFGDPHAIYNASTVELQVGGFIAVTNKDSPILDVMGSIAEVPRKFYFPDN